MDDEKYLIVINGISGKDDSYAHRQIHILDTDKNEWK